MPNFAWRGTQAGGGLARAAYAHRSVNLFEVQWDTPSSWASVKLMASMRCCNPWLSAMPWKRPAAWVEALAEFALEEFDELLEEIEEEGIRFLEAPQPPGIDRVLKTIGQVPLSTAASGSAGTVARALLGRVDEGQAVVWKRVSGKAGPAGCGQGLGSDAGAVGNEENGAGHPGHVGVASLGN